MKPLTLADLAINGEAPVTLSVMPHSEVASRVWYSLEWTGDDGKRHTVEASTLDLLMQRMNQVESMLRAWGAVRRHYEAQEERP